MFGLWVKVRQNCRSKSDQYRSKKRKFSFWLQKKVRKNKALNLENLNSTSFPRELKMNIFGCFEIIRNRIIAFSSSNLFNNEATMQYNVTRDTYMPSSIPNIVASKIDPI